MKITLIHPSRGRAEKAKKTFDYWIEQSSRLNTIEHILSIDSDDNNIEQYIALFNKSIVCTYNNTNVVEATNRAAKYATGDVLIYLSDDFKCPKNWDERLAEIFSPVDDGGKIKIEYSHPVLGSGEIKAGGYVQLPRLLKVDDCLQKFEVAVLTIPIMNMALYKLLGYFWHPGYKSMFVDEDLYWTTKNNGWLMFCEDLKFPHEHPCNGLAENDETYKRSAANWDSGKEFYAQRKLNNFPL